MDCSNASLLKNLEQISFTQSKEIFSLEYSVFTNINTRNVKKFSLPLKIGLIVARDRNAYKIWVTFLQEVEEKT